MGKDWKTTTAGLIAGLTVVLKYTGIDLPVEVTDALTALAIAILGFLTRDSTRSTG